MDYLDESRILAVFNNLLEIDSEIYDLTMGDLVNFEKNGIENTDEFLVVVKRVRLLKVKEQRLLESIGSSEYYYAIKDIFNDMIDDICEDNLEKALALNERFDDIFETMDNIENAIEEEIYNISLEDYIDDYEDDEPIEIAIDISGHLMDYYTPIQISFLKYLKSIDPQNEEYLKQKYYLSFTYPELEKELCIGLYNPDNLYGVPMDVDAKLSSVDESEYEESVDLAKTNFALESIREFFALACTDGVSNDKLDLAFRQTMFSISIVDTKMLAEFANEYFTNNENYIITNEALDYVQSLSKELLDEMHQREDFDENIMEEVITEKENLENEEDNIILAKKDYDNLFGVIDATKSIYKTFTTLFMLELIGDKGSKQYKEGIDILGDLVTIEKEYAMQLDLDIEESIKAMEIIEDNLELSFELDEDLKLINSNEISYTLAKKRISNLIFHTEVPDTFQYASDEVPDTILRNYHLECLKEYDEVISELEDKPDYMRHKYMEIFSDAEMTEEFIATDGDLTRTVSLDDETICNLLDIDIEEYEFDRERLINDCLYDIIAELANISKENSGVDDIIDAIIEYKTISLNVALGYCDKEEVETLKLGYEATLETDNSVLSERLSKIFNKQAEKKLELSKKRH